MKKTLLPLTILFIIFQSKIHSSPDSIRVTLCTYSNSIECFGLDKYTKTIEYYNSTGKTDSIKNYVLSKCPAYPVDTIYQLVSDDFYSYDSLQRLAQRNNFNYYLGGNSEIMWSYSYDSSGNHTNTLVKDGPPGNLTNNNQDSLVYDSLNRIISEIYLRWNTLTSSWDSTDLYYWSYNSMNSQTFNMRRHLNSQTLIIDTSYVYYWTYDSLNRNTQIDYYNFNPPNEDHKHFMYDSFSNIIQTDHSNTWIGYVDSTQVLDNFTPTNRKSESLFRSWDTLQLKWNNTSRQQFVYDASDTLVKIFYFNCPDSTCSDTAKIKTYEYDAFHHLLSISDSILNSGIWDVRYSTIYTYDANGNIVTSSHSDPPDHCSETVTYTYDYNAINQITHEHYYRVTCDYWLSDCYYYNLTGDSMMVDIYYPFQTCQGDTIYPIVTSIGGIPPYTYQWSPAGDILNPNQLATGIVADTVRTYMLQVTDLNGISQTASFTLNVNCFTTNILTAEGENLFVSVYPNPFHDFVNVVINKNNVQVIISDIEGREIKTVFSESGKISIDENTLKAGLYFMKIISDDRFIKTIKLIAE